MMNHLENMIVGLNATAEIPEIDTEATSETAGATEAPKTETKMDIQFQPKNFVKGTRYMGAGMLGIFVVIGLIIIVTAVLNRVTAPKKNS